MPILLSVNLNAVAMLRNRRDLPWPSVEHLGRVALQAGASGLTVHPRPDQRHIRFSDLPVIRALIDTEFPQAEFNIEGYPSEDFLDLCERIKPSGTDRIELYTGPYGGCFDDWQRAVEMLEQLGRTADAAFAAGMGVNAGHDLTVENLPALVTRIPKLAEVSIGHGLTADALEHGMAETVRRFRRVCGQTV